MFDNLRQQSVDSQDEPDAPAERGGGSRPGFSMGGGGFSLNRLPIISSLNPMQRFVLAFMLFLNVSVLGCFALIAFEKIVLF